MSRLPERHRPAVVRVAVVVALALLLIGARLLFLPAGTDGFLVGPGALGDTYRLVADVEEVDRNDLSVSSYTYADEPGEQVERRVRIVRQTEFVAVRESGEAAASRQLLRPGQRIRVHTAQDPAEHGRLTASKIEVFMNE